MQRIVFTALIGFCFGGFAVAAEESDATPARNLYRTAVSQTERASNLERKGKVPEAIDAYEAAGQVCEAAIAELDAGGTPFEERAPDVYYRAATSYLHAGRLLAHEKRDGQQKDDDLAKAATYLDAVDKIEIARAQRAGTEINPEVWRVRNAAAYTAFLRGELAQARMHYEAVLEMNPTYRPAELAIAEINKLEREQNEIFSPQGRTANKEKTRRAIREVISTLKLVRDIVSLGR